MLGKLVDGFKDTKMKKLCVFYKYANEYVGKKIQWIVCKECQRKLQDPRSSAHRRL